MTAIAASARREGPTYAELMQARVDEANAAGARKRDIEAGAEKALSNPLTQGPETAKQQAHAKVQQLIERVKILKKLFSASPEQMARALAQIFKELKAAVKAYQAAGGRELGMSGALAQSAVVPPSGASVAAKSDGAEAEGAEPPGGGAPEAGPAVGAGLYEAVNSRVRERLGDDGMAFIKEVRAFTSALKDLLEISRIKSMAPTQNKGAREAFEDADDEVKALDKAVDDMERDIRQQVPTVGMKLSIAA